LAAARVAWRQHRGSESTAGLSMKKFADITSLPGMQQGKAGYILLWLLGVPIPILFLIYLLRGCS
jgi:hypothetical protein